MGEQRDTAGVIAFPPLIFGVPLIAGVVADRLLFKQPLPHTARVLSTGFFFAAGSLAVRSVREFRAAGTPVDPYEETTALIESGPFAQTRNPLYVALTLAYTGAALAARTALPLTLLPAVLRVMSAGVIAREERYLRRKFGERYRAYMERVPRWL
jgi:protein-S-isoprenylcysteine O-methyltransferase Ste14